MLRATLPPEPVWLYGDAVRLVQVFANLLVNACKFTETGWVEIRAERRGGTAQVTVKDTGIGIAAEKLGTIFDMFAQLDRTLERRSPGLGVGLALAKRIVELHGGMIEARSEGAGRGSEFQVRLPALGDVRAAESDDSGEQPAVAGGRRFLVVDDNRDLASSLCTLLRMSGNDAQMAHDGEAALRAVSLFQPDVVLLDIGLPKLNGYEACRRIREQADGREPLVIAMTGWGQNEDRRRSDEAGFSAHMVKPVRYAALMELLSELKPPKA
jgi:CheY-like chemotaxis protein